MKALFEKVYNKQDLTKAEMKQVAALMLSDQLSEAQIAGFLIGLRMKGETPDEMTGLAEYMKEIAVPIPVDPAGTMCNCGTGGDQSNSFNVSTTAAFVLAAGGVKVAKSGNRSVSSKSGSFDTCEALGINFMLPPQALATLMDEVGISFIFAPQVHPYMKYIGPVRKALATPTIFNLIGPLANPVHLEYQLMGTYRRDLLEFTAKTIRQLGRKSAIVVNGAGGMDEVSLAGENKYARLKDGEITLHTLSAADMGLPVVPQEAIIGGGPEENAEILIEILKGQESPYFDTVVANAGLGLYAAEKADSVIGGVTLARQLLKDGAAYDRLQLLLKRQEEVK